MKKQNIAARDIDIMQKEEGETEGIKKDI